MACQQGPKLEAKALPAQTMTYADGVSALYYQANAGDVQQRDTVLFTYGATGCVSMKHYTPDYFRAIRFNGVLFALNKRYVGDLDNETTCGEDFIKANVSEQRMKDFSAFINSKLKQLDFSPRNVVVIGVSEAADAAVHAASLNPHVTQLVVIGSGGYTMRKSLQVMRQHAAPGQVPDVDAFALEYADKPIDLNDNWYGNPVYWWTDILDFDPMPDYLKVDIPILIGVGEQDDSQPLASVHYLQRQFSIHGKQNLQVKVYPGVGHSLTVDAKRDLFGELNLRLANKSH
ncbi:dienelactone hydrolase family protein [Pseudomonas entomophila]|uniref:dienelactone hydrolase family protein n=1 Tax=Pseudomonas entomophila TaxID=312306 RepID=UPI0023D7C2BA|nr:dienelactone hydrolase family protein [Pseudomonas entomophila]MDF0731805.1 dienelactone hydrolase family protein [Pseudomonas entomophila]